MQILGEYLDKIKDINESDKEHRYRSSLEYLFESIKNELSKNNKEIANIKIEHEPANDKSGLGAPDFRFLKGDLNLGYIENKRVNADLWKLINEANKDEKAQVAKYLNLSNNLILTDYLRFWGVAKDEKGKIYKASECEICNLSELSKLSKTKQTNTKALLESKEKELLNFFTIFYNAEPKPINTAKEFASALAFPTRYLKDALIELEKEARMQSLYKNFLKGIYEELDFSDFCDNLAQTLIYSLFLAKFQKDLEGNQKSPITLSNLTDYISKSFALLGAVANDLKNIKEFPSLKWLLEYILRIINYIDISALIQEFHKHFKDIDPSGEKTIKNPTIYFYEHFINAYNPTLREKRGVYYTPPAIVSFIIDSIDLVLKQDLDYKEGLKEATQNDMRLLDFATGTGAFLIEAFSKAFSSFKNQQNLASYDNRLEKLIENFRAFELMIAPYAIANLNLLIVLQDEYNYKLKENERLNIFLTNTLELREKIEANLFETEKEAEAANDTKNKKILIITGNPPYNALSLNKYDIENYKFCGVDKDKKPIANKDKKHRLNDDYIKFICFAQRKISQQESGVVAIISNNSFLDGATMNGMRWNLLNSFDKIYILNLHGDSNKQEKIPNTNIQDSNVFDIMQGVAISIFIKTSAKPQELKYFSNEPKCELFYSDLFGKRMFKYQFLHENTLKTIKWQRINPKAKFYSFIPQDEKALKEYEEAWSVRDIFILSGLGICTYRDEFCYADTKELLRQKLERFKDAKDIESLRLEFNLPKDTRDWTIQDAKNEILNTKNDENYYTKVHFKPFDFKYTYFTGKSKKFLGRPAGITQGQMRKENLSLVCDRGCKKQEVDNFFISNIPFDLHLVGSGSYAFPLYIYREVVSKDNKTKLNSLFFGNDEERLENLTPDFRKFIDEKYGEHFKPEQILGYIYAVLFHKHYREKYLDFLKIDFPKIPFVKSKELFLELSALGLELIALHLLEYENLDKDIGQARFKDINNRNFIISKLDYKETKQELFVNESLYFKGVSAGIWHYKIGGYQVLDKYLKSHKGENINYEHFEKIIQTLAKSLEIEALITSNDLQASKANTRERDEQC